MLQRLSISLILGALALSTAARAAEYDRMLLGVATIPILNQKATNTCWIQSLSNAAYLTNCGPLGIRSRRFHISSDYVDYFHLLRTTMRAIRSPENTTMSVFDEGDIGEALEIIETYGIVPQEVYSVPISKQTTDLRRRLMEALRIAAFTLKPKLLEFENGNRNMANPRYAGVAKKAQDEVLAILGFYMGHPPPSFLFKGAKYAPKEFAKKFFPIQKYEIISAAQEMYDEIETIPPFAPDADLLVKAMSADKAEAEEANAAVDKGTKEYAAKLEATRAKYKNADMIPKIRAIIDSGRPVILYTWALRRFWNDRTGVISIEKAFPNEPMIPIPKLAETFAQDLRSFAPGSHATVIVGYDFDEKGELVKFRILNSYGAEAGKAGFFDMHRDYFEYFAKAAFVIQNIPAVPTSSGLRP